MRYRRADVIEAALRVLDDYSLADLSMRRLAGELGLQAGALYHHVPNKQALLALMADEVLARGRRTTDPDAPWQEQALQICSALRDAMLAWRDGAELVSTAYAFGLGASAPYDDLLAVLTQAGLDPQWCVAGARTLLHVTFGHVGQEQTYLQAASAGAIDSPANASPTDPDPYGTPPVGAESFAASLRLVLSGLDRERAARRP